MKLHVRHSRLFVVAHGELIVELREDPIREQQATEVPVDVQFGVGLSLHLPLQLVLERSQD